MTEVRRRAAGWYDDEADATVLRYWDGVKWTPHTTPRPDDEPADEVRPSVGLIAAEVSPAGAGDVSPAGSAGSSAGPAGTAFDESTAMRPAPAQAPAPAPAVALASPPAQPPTPTPVFTATQPGWPTMTSSSPEFVSDTLRAPSFSPAPVLHTPNEHTTAPLPPNDGRAAASAPSPAAATTGDRSFLLTWLFALLLGPLGVDRFYLGKVGTAVAKLVTAGGFGVWTLIDLVLVLTGAQRDRDGHVLRGYDEHRRLALIVSGVLVAVGVLATIATSLAIASLTASLGSVGGLG